MPVELMFYFLLPLLILCQRRYGLGLVVAGILAVTLAWRSWVIARYTGHDFSAPELLMVLDALPGVLMTFGAGFGAAFLQDQIKKASAIPLLWASILLFIVLQTLLVSFIEIYWQGGWLLCLWNSGISISMAGFIVALCKLPDHVPYKFLSTKPMIALGDWSFGIYLWHFPVLELLKRLFPDWGASPFSSLWALGITLVVTVFMAALSFINLERPLMRLKITR
jgi:peptidoglycan/LPS O-acetylase OafA/YrhL